MQRLNNTSTLHHSNNVEFSESEKEYWTEDQFNSSTPNFSSHEYLVERYQRPNPENERQVHNTREDYSVVTRQNALNKNTQHVYHAHISPPSKLTGHVPHISHNHITQTHHVPVQTPPDPLPLQIHHVPIVPAGSPRLPLSYNSTSRDNQEHIQSKTHHNHVTKTVQSVSHLVRGNHPA